ncbi:PepSY domain-containing protein [Nocardia sp. NPDC051052]|uniref:PepSY domain-containing protein n=1 Tax=Nocardia sp. NPDC051052 TaxID=3364322 RepID=UPI00379DB380
MKAVVITPFVVAAVVAATACGHDPDQHSATPATGTSDISSSAPTLADSAPVDLARNSFAVSPQDVLAAAQEKFAGTLTKLELEPEGVSPRTSYVYKVELMSDQEKYTTQLAADSGAVISERKENLDADERDTERRRDAVDFGKAVPLNEAMSTATRAHPGRVGKWKIEGKDNTAKYEFDIYGPADADEDHEVQVDAYSGQLATAG